MKKIFTRIMFLLLPLAVGLLLGIILILLFENNVVYHPIKYSEGMWNTSLLDLPIEECTFTTSDGLKLHGWFLPNDTATITLLWLHGNAGNIIHRLDQLRRFRLLQCNIFIIDYRGYGRSEGEPTEDGLYLDTVAAYDYLRTRNDVQHSKIFVYGQSLGTADAVDLATKRSCSGLILESSLTNAKDMAKEMFPWFPIHLFIRSRFDSETKIRSLHLPLLFVHGSDDDIIPITLGKKLFDSANEPKQFYEISGAGHNDCYVVGSTVYMQLIKEFMIQT
ncbi:MAG: alpha/beta hydrolase [Ignavibacteriae bacterium]|nr:alpha/beta hydrolase [Ignavibacteriota bacterium]